MFVEAARARARRIGRQADRSALSVLSGVQRRDIRPLGDAALVEARPKTPSIASQVFTRWLTDAALRDKRDQPIPLPKNGEAPSFDALAREMSSDVHPRTLLSEMSAWARCASTATPCSSRRRPSCRSEGSTRWWSCSPPMRRTTWRRRPTTCAARARSSSNKACSPAACRARSTQALSTLARRLWRPAFQEMARDATQRLPAGSARRHPTMRMRFGVYFYAEPLGKTTTVATRHRRRRGARRGHANPGTQGTRPRTRKTRAPTALARTKFDFNWRAT